jgi:hypothetical protein
MASEGVLLMPRRAVRGDATCLPHPLGVSGDDLARKCHVIARLEDFPPFRRPVTVIMHELITVVRGDLDWCDLSSIIFGVWREYEEPHICNLEDTGLADEGQLEEKAKRIRFAVAWINISRE